MMIEQKMVVYNNNNKLELTKHITQHANGELFSSGAPHIQIIIPHFCNDCLLSGLPMAMVHTLIS